MNRTVTACLFEAPFEELPTWQEMLDAGAGRLSAAGVAEAELDAWYLLSDSFSIDRVHFLMDRNRTVHPGTFEKRVAGFCRAHWEAGSQNSSSADFGLPGVYGAFLPGQ